MKGFRVETIRGLKNMRHHNKVFSKSTILQELIIFFTNWTGAWSDPSQLSNGF